MKLGNLVEPPCGQQLPHLEETIPESHWFFTRKHLLKRKRHGTAILSVDKRVGRRLSVRTTAEHVHVGFGFVFRGVHVRLVAGKVIVPQIQLGSAKTIIKHGDQPRIRFQISAQRVFQDVVLDGDQVAPDQEVVLLVRPLFKGTVAAEVEKQSVPRIRRSQQPRKSGEKVAGSGSCRGSIGEVRHFRVAVRAQEGGHVGDVVETAVELVGCSGVIASAEHGAFSGFVITLELLGKSGVVLLDGGAFVGGQETADGALVLLEFGELSLERHIASILILFRSASSLKALEYAQALTNSEGCF